MHVRREVTTPVGQLDACSLHDIVQNKWVASQVQNYIEVEEPGKFYLNLSFFDFQAGGLEQAVETPRPVFLVSIHPP